MHRIEKFLRKLSSSERRVAEELIAKIVAKDFAGLNVKKLQGVQDLFRVRKGDLRILYTFDNKGRPIILDAVRRGDTTYNF